MKYNSSEIKYCSTIQPHANNKKDKEDKMVMKPNARNTSFLVVMPKMSMSEKWYTYGKDS